MEHLLAIRDAVLLASELGGSALSVAGVDVGRGRTGFPVPSEFVELAAFECDALVIEPKTREVVMLDHEVKGRIILPIAKDVFGFVRALAHIDAHFKDCETDEALYEDHERIMAVSQSAASAAGGERYLPFWRSMIFGI